MRIIEVTDMGVRSAVINLERLQTPLRFVLIPMVHIGTPEFYAAVCERVSRCDLVIAEGQPSKRRHVSLRALAYRLVRSRSRSRLVLQDVREEALGVPVVRPDLTVEEIRKGLRRLPAATYLLARLSIWVLVPWIVLYLVLFGAERFWANELALDDDTPYIEPSPGERWEAIEQVILDDRDALLIEALSKIHQERCAQAIDVAVIYGARHIPAVVHGLHSRHGYRAMGAEWLTVFDLDD